MSRESLLEVMGEICTLPARAAVGISNSTICAITGEHIIFPLPDQVKQMKIVLTEDRNKNTFDPK